MNAATTMWTVWGGVAGLNIASHGRTPTTSPPTRSKPRGWFIHAFAVTTKNADATPATSTGTPVSTWIRGGRRSQAYSQIPRKIASMKKANPSSAKPTPMIGPANSMNRGQSRPSSNERTVPETAPTAKRMAVPLAHRFAKARYTSCLVRSQRHSATTIISGIAIPTAAKIM
jgi:hypothetical protein